MFDSKQRRLFDFSHYFPHSNLRRSLCLRVSSCRNVLPLTAFELPLRAAAGSKASCKAFIPAPSIEVLSDAFLSKSASVLRCGLPKIFSPTKMPTINKTKNNNPKMSLIKFCEGSDFIFLDYKDFFPTGKFPQTKILPFISNRSYSAVFLLLIAFPGSII